MLNAIANILEDAGYQVLRAANGAEALDQLEARKRRDLILLDLLMPVMHGWDFRRSECRRRVSQPFRWS